MAVIRSKNLWLEERLEVLLLLEQLGHQLHCHQAILPPQHQSLPTPQLIPFRVVVAALVLLLLRQEAVTLQVTVAVS
jgi:hypothetical protein